MDRLFSHMGWLRRPLLAALCAMMLVPVPQGAEAEPVFFSLLFPQLMPDWMWCPWAEAQDGGLMGDKAAAEGICL